MPLLQTKLYLPRRSAAQGRHAYVNRPRLLEMLAVATSGKLTLLSAPAGFGKSTLLRNGLQIYASSEPIGSLLGHLTTHLLPGSLSMRAIMTPCASGPM